MGWEKDKQGEENGRVGGERRRGATASDTRKMVKLEKTANVLSAFAWVGLGACQQHVRNLSLCRTVQGERQAQKSAHKSGNPTSREHVSLPKTVMVVLEGAVTELINLRRRAFLGKSCSSPCRGRDMGANQINPW